MISCSAGEAVRWEDAQGNILQWESPSPAFLKLLWHDERRPDATPKPTGHVVLVENRDTLLHLPTRLPAVLSGALVAHYEGWLSERLLALLVSWESAKIWLLPDLDPVGLANARRIAEALPCAGMLVPLLSPEIVDQYGDETIWRESFALVPALLPWLEQQDPPLRDLFALLKCKGRGVEQEYCLAVPSTVLEPIELRRADRLTYPVAVANPISPVRFDELLQRLRGEPLKLYLVFFEVVSVDVTHCLVLCFDEINGGFFATRCFLLNSAGKNSLAKSGGTMAVENHK
ncbi:Uncharacterised protein [Pseudomonas aeruginosa]|nr:Uncharacterised protein [Pseudomonas aeruginosa]